MTAPPSTRPKRPRRPAWLGLLICLAAACGVGALAAVTPVWAVLAIPFLVVAGAFGYFTRRVYLAALGAPVIGLAAAVGLGAATGASGQASDVIWDCLGLFVSGGGLICILPAALGGLLGDISAGGGIDGILRAMGPRSDRDA